MFEINQEVRWRHTVSNYGHAVTVRAKVVRVGKRVTIEVPLMGGGVRKTVVRPENLEPIASTNHCSCFCA